MDTAKRGAPLKPPEKRKASMVMVRLTEAERNACEAAADSEGLKMSAWARKTLTQAAKRRSAKT